MGESFNNTSYLSLSKNEICHDISPNSTINIYDYRENDDTPGDLDIIKDPILVMSQSAFLWPQKNHQRRFFLSVYGVADWLKLPTAARGSAKRPPHPGEKVMKHPKMAGTSRKKLSNMWIENQWKSSINVGFNIILYSKITYKWRVQY